MRRIWVVSAEQQEDEYFTSKKKALKHLAFIGYTLDENMDIYDESGSYYGRLERRALH